MLKVKCPLCGKINTELLWNETTAEKLHENLKRLIPLRSQERSSKYYCPSCEQPSLRSNLTIETNDEEVCKRVFLSAYTKAASQIKMLHDLGVVADTKDNILKILPLVSPVYCIRLHPYEGASINKDVRNMIIRVLSGTLCHLLCYTLDEHGAPQEEALGYLTFQHTVKNNETVLIWKSCTRDSWSDPNACIISHKQKQLRRKALERNYVPPKTRMGSDGMFYVSYPTVDGKKMQTIKLDEFMGNPMNYKADLTFDEFLKMLCDTEVVHQNPPTLAERVASLEEEPIPVPQPVAVSQSGDLNDEDNNEDDEDDE